MKFRTARYFAGVCAASFAALVMLPPVASADTIDNPGTLLMELASSSSPLLQFADGSMLHQSGRTIEGQMEPDGTWYFIGEDFGAASVYDAATNTVIQVNGGPLQAQLILAITGSGIVDGITQEIDWSLPATVRFLFPGSGGGCITPSFTIDISGDFGLDDTFYSDPIQIPALTTGCGSATLRGTVNSALDLGTSGAEMALYKFTLDPFPTGS